MIELRWLDSPFVIHDQLPDGMEMSVPRSKILQYRIGQMVSWSGPDSGGTKIEWSAWMDVQTVVLESLLPPSTRSK